METAAAMAEEGESEVKRHPPARRMMPRTEGQPPGRQVKTLHDLLALHERFIIIQTLERHRFSRQKAAEALGVTRNYLWRRMRLLGVDFSALPRTTPGRPRKKLVVLTDGKSFDS